MADHRLLMSEEPEGWSVIPRGGETLRGKRHICFYVHGYNSSPREAKKSFDQLIANVRREAHVHPNSSVPALDGSEAWRVYWPAYARLALDRSVVSALTYPLHVKAVGEWAEVFATFLGREFAGLEATPVEVTFVAHSLGCRFILETLRLKRQYNQRTWTIRSIILMAAAVPVGLLETNERLHQAASDPRSRYVAYSPNDPVLQLAFRLGQMVEGGILPTAVGANGAPSAIWSERLRTMNGHSGYFGDPRTARFIAAGFGLSTFREVDAREIPKASILTRAATTIATMSSRFIRKRRLAE